MSDDIMKEAATAYEVKSPFSKLADEIYKEKVLRARRTSLGKKLLAGEELFNYACEITMAGIRNENPGLNEDEVLRILDERLALRKRLEARS